MSDALSFAEVVGQRVELLPARLVLGIADALSGGGAHGGAGGPSTLEAVNLGSNAEQALNLDTGGGNAVGGLYSGA